MEMTELMPYIVQALGGAIAGNVMGALTRGGGGIIGRTLIGAIGGIISGQVAPHILPGDLYSSLFALTDGDNSEHVGNLIIGASGGGVLGLFTGIFMQPRA